MQRRPGKRHIPDCIRPRHIGPQTWHHVCFRGGNIEQHHVNPEDCSSHSYTILAIGKRYDFPAG